MADKKIAELVEIDGIVAGDWFPVGDTSASDNAKKATPDQVKTGIGLANVTNDQQLKRAGSDFSTFTQKGTPAVSDLLLIEDSAASYAKKKITFDSIVALPPRAMSWSSQTSITPNADSYDLFILTNQTGSTLTINPVSGTLVLGRRIIVMVNAGGSVTITWSGSAYGFLGTGANPLITTLANGESLIHEFIYDSDRSMFVAIGGGKY